MMARRRTHHRRRSHHVARVVVVVLVLLVVVHLAAHLAGVLLLVTAAGAGCYRLGLSRRPVTKAAITTADPETAMLRQQAAWLQYDLDQARAAAWQLLTDCNADVARLRGELADAQASAVAAWDQASSRPPRRTTGDTAPLDLLDAERLAATPMSGARSLFGCQP